MINKIKTLSFNSKIIVSFVVIVGLMSLISASSLFNFAKTLQQITQISETALPHALLAEEMAFNVVQVQQFLTDVSATHDPAGYEDAEQAAKNFKQYLGELRKQADRSSAHLQVLNQLEAAFDKFYGEGKRMTAAYLTQGIDAGNMIMENFDQMSLDLAAQMKKVKDGEVDDAKTSSAALVVSTRQASILIAVIALTTLFFVAGIAVYLTRYLKKQLGTDPFYASAIVKEIAKGNFTRDIRLDSEDTGSLLHALKIMQSSINDFVAAQHALAKKHAEGWIGEQMDVSQFRGAYAAMAQEVNTLVRSHIDVNMQVVDVISRYAQGDFSADMPSLPGDKAKITKAIDGVKNTLFNVASEIKALAEAGARGDFSRRSDASRFNYMFKDILTDFDSLIDSCDGGFKDILRVANAMAAGDLTQTIEKSYPGTFGAVIAGMNETSENLKSLISEIKIATDTIYTAAKEIAAGNNDLSHRTEEQAASLEETAASMSELTSTVQTNAQNAGQANQLARGAAEIAAKGGQVVSQVVTTMDSIHESSRKITDIISVIDGIAFQTNILALNAAVEAARAGEQGRGFAVVAGEVRNLAHRAAAAAGEIKGLIGDSVEQVEEGGKLVARAGSTMKEIVGAIDQVTGIIAGITAASSEQSSGILQVNMTIAQMDDVTQQNAALVEQAAASAESLEEQAEHLSANVAKFKIGPNTLPSVNVSAGTETYRSKMAAIIKPILQKAVSDEWEEF